MNETQNQVTSSDYVLLGLLIWINVLNLVDRNLIVSLSAFIVPDLGLTNTEFGLLTGFVFIAFYSVMGLFMGILADRVNRIRLMAVALSVWSILTAVSGAARGFASIAIPRAFIGIGESAIAPSALSLLGNRFPSSRLGFVSSLFLLSLPIGIGVSFIVAGTLAPQIGWRGCFYLLGAIGVISAPFLFFFKDPRTSTDKSKSASIKVNFSFSVAIKDVLSVLKNSRTLRLIIIGAMLIALNYSVLGFDQLWLVQERGFERSEIARITGWFAIIFGVAGALHGAFLLDYLYARFALPRERFIAYTWLALLPFLILYRLAEADTALFWAGFASIYLMSAATSGPMFAAVQASAPSNMRATVIAFQMLCSSFVGIGAGALIIGSAIDWLAAEGVSQPYTRVLLSATAFSGLGILAFYVAGSGQLRPAGASEAIDGHHRDP